MSEYTPTMAEVRGSYVVHNFRDCHSRPGEAEHQSVNQFGAEFERWLAAHDAELREQIAQELYTHLPIMLRDQAADECGWLSDMPDVWLDHGTDVTTPDGTIDVEQVGEYAATIARGE